MFNWVKKKFNKQKIFRYCPQCKNELLSSGSYIGDDKYINYKYANCGLITHWSFDTSVYEYRIYRGGK